MKKKFHLTEMQQSDLVVGVILALLIGVTLFFVLVDVQKLGLENAQPYTKDNNLPNKGYILKPGQTADFKHSLGARIYYTQVTNDGGGIRLKVAKDSFFAKAPLTGEETYYLKDYYPFEDGGGFVRIYNTQIGRYFTVLVIDKNQVYTYDNPKQEGGNY